MASHPDSASFASMPDKKHQMLQLAFGASQTRQAHSQQIQAQNSRIGGSYAHNQPVVLVGDPKQGLARTFKPFEDRRHGRGRPRSMLTNEQAAKIYSLRRPGDGKSSEIGAEYGVSAKTIRDIWNRRTWGHATKHLWTEGEEAFVEPATGEANSSTPTHPSLKRRPPGRPSGSKDSKPRARRTPEEDNAMALDPLGKILASPAAQWKYPLLPSSHLDSSSPHSELSLSVGGITNSSLHQAQGASGLNILTFEQTRGAGVPSNSALKDSRHQFDASLDAIGLSGIAFEQARSAVGSNILAFDPSRYQFKNSQGRTGVSNSNNSIFEHCRGGGGSVNLPSGAGSDFDTIMASNRCQSADAKLSRVCSLQHSRGACGVSSMAIGPGRNPLCGAESVAHLEKLMAAGRGHASGVESISNFEKNVASCGVPSLGAESIANLQKLAASGSISSSGAEFIHKVLYGLERSMPAGTAPSSEFVDNALPPVSSHTVLSSFCGNSAGMPSVAETVEKFHVCASSSSNTVSLASRRNSFESLLASESSEQGHTSSSSNESIVSSAARNYVQQPPVSGPDGVQFHLVHGPFDRNQWTSTSSSGEVEKEKAGGRDAVFASSLGVIASTHKEGENRAASVKHIITKLEDTDEQSVLAAANDNVKAVPVSSLVAFRCQVEGEKNAAHQDKDICVRERRVQGDRADSTAQDNVASLGRESHAPTKKSFSLDAQTQTDPMLLSSLFELLEQGHWVPCMDTRSPQQPVPVYHAQERVTRAHKAVDGKEQFTLLCSTAERMIPRTQGETITPAHTKSAAMSTQGFETPCTAQEAVTHTHEIHTTCSAHSPTPKFIQKIMQAASKDQHMACSSRHTSSTLVQDSQAIMIETDMQDRSQQKMVAPALNNHVTTSLEPRSPSSAKEDITPARHQHARDQLAGNNSCEPEPLCIAEESKMLDLDRHEEQFRAVVQFLESRGLAGRACEHSSDDDSQSEIEPREIGIRPHDEPCADSDSEADHDEPCEAEADSDDEPHAKRRRLQPVMVSRVISTRPHEEPRALSQSEEDIDQPCEADSDSDD